MEGRYEMKVHVVNHMRHDIQVHRVGCADIEREKRRGRLNSDWKLEVPEGKAVAEAVADDLNEGFGWPETYRDPVTGEVDEPAPWDASHVKVMPCVAKGGVR